MSNIHEIIVTVGTSYRLIVDAPNSVEAERIATEWAPEAEHTSGVKSVWLIEECDRTVQVF
jgi:hypothetical protein